MAGGLDEGEIETCRKIKWVTTLSSDTILALSLSRSLALSLSLSLSLSRVLLLKNRLTQRNSFKDNLVRNCVLLLLQITIFDVDSLVCTYVVLIIYSHKWM